MQHGSVAVVVSLALMFGARAPTATYASDRLVYGNTASIVAGDIAIDDLGIGLADSEAPDFSALTSDRFDVDRSPIPVSVYRLKSPDDPVLETSNKLRGSANVSDVAPGVPASG